MGWRLIVSTLLAWVLLASCDAKVPVGAVTVPEGFAVNLYHADVPGARSLSLGPDGVVIVGSRGAGRVYALDDADGDGRAERRAILLEGLDSPNGVAYRDGFLYVAEIGRIRRWRFDADALAVRGEAQSVYGALPSEAHHGWRYIAFGPDGRLYVAVGVPCNVCDEPGYGEIRSMDADGEAVRVVAEGVRNSVGFDWHPRSGELWFTDNGRDWMGDNRPPDELNRAPRPGLHFGFPYCHGADIADPEFGRGRDCGDYRPPVQELGPHVAALGMRFYDGDMFPAAYRNQIFIAEHGSWNRSEKIGYRVSLVRLESGEAVGYEPFARGWLDDGTVRGRPVDVQVMPDGALLVSDDAAGAVYRISYE